MKAIAAHRYGPPESVQIEDRPKPVPKPGDVLIRIRAATVSAADWRMRSGDFPRGFGLLARLALGLFGPRNPILGTDLAGEVEAVAPGVTAFRPGDAVIAFVGAGGGCHAEYRAVPVSAALCRKPEGLTWEQAAALPFGGTTALYFLRDLAKVTPADRVLIVGASGAVGSAAVQLARHLGAGVTAVTSTPNVDLVRSLGAEHVIDYRHADWTRLGRQWDVILDTTGTVTVAMARPSLLPGGRLALVAAGLPQLLFGRWARGLTVLTGTAPARPEDLLTLAALATSGALTPVVSVALPLAQAAKAHAIGSSRRKVGNVVLTMN